MTQLLQSKPLLQKSFSHERYVLCVKYIVALPYYQLGDHYPLDSKPYVYRWLSLWLIDMIERIGFEYEFASLLFIGISGAVFVFAMLYLMHTVLPLARAELVSLLLLVVFTLLFQRYLKPYDLPTAAGFALALALLARWKFIAYLIVFLFLCLNRETAILLLPIYMLHFWKRLEERTYWPLVIVQAVTFVTVQAAIRYALRSAPGSSMWISPAQNILAHIENPVPTLLSLVVIGLVLWLVFRDWRYKPSVLRHAFIVLAPALFVLYVVAGQAFEYRVFAEVYSATALLILAKG